MQIDNFTRLKKMLLDIRFWIVLFFVIRLFGITNAPLEIGHNWRQSLTNMITRNFFENGANLLYPAIDMAGEKTGIIGSEFPLFNYLIYLVSELFGYEHWYGRLINLIVSSLGIYYFYRLLKESINEKVAFNASIILLSSIWFVFSRKIMPDTFSVSLVIIGLYYAYQFLRNGKFLNVFLFFTFCTLGMLCKIPALSLFSLLGITLFIPEISVQRKIQLYTTAALSFGIVCLWYFYWVPHLLATYQYQLYFPKGFMEGLIEIKEYIPELLEKFYFSSLSSFAATLCFIVGIVLIVKSKHQLLKVGITLVSIVFIVFIIKTGSVFPLHNYYIIPFTPIMAIIAGFAISKFSNKYQWMVLALIAIEGIANQQHDFFIKDSKLYKLELDEITANNIPNNELIVINGGQSPQDIYFSHRKGWTAHNHDVLRPEYIDSLNVIGANYLIIDKHRLEQKFNELNSIYEDENYLIYNLQK
jgi:4-amino-4-deoxy-L-arabinose transferase-like glycosyltransferase